MKPGHGAGRPRKQIELLKRENRSLKQVVCRLRELQAKIDEMRAKTSVPKTPKRESAARRATERGVVSLAGGYKCVLLRNGGHAGADAVVAHLDTGIARQTVCRWEHLLGASVLAPCPRLLQRSIHPAARSSVSGGPRAESGRLDVGSARLAWRRHQLEQPARTTRLTKMISGLTVTTTGPSTARTAT